MLGLTDMKLLAIIILALLLCACSGSDAPAIAPPEQGTVSEGNVFKSDADALARAKEAEKVIHDAAEQRRKDIEAGQ